jgi:hypothetical protein
MIQIKDCEIEVDILEVGGTLVVENARELRRLVEWYRAFAEVGLSEERDGRLRLAEYLERKVVELEKRAAENPRK